MHRLFKFLSAILLLAATPLVAQSVSRPAVIGATLTEKFPYSMAGQLIFSSGDYDFQGSGTVINKLSVLTAAHNIWDVDAGWSYDMEFNRARSGQKIATHVMANRIFVFGGYQNAVTRNGADSVRAFAYDLGGVRFKTMPSDGSFAGWKSDLSLITGSIYNICIGYGAETHTGDDMLFVEPRSSFYQTFSAFYENDTLTFEGGMSGGPVFATVAPNDLRIVGVIVAGSDDPPTGGIRAINATGARFISTYLRY